MISIDADLLLYSYCEASPHHLEARAFVDGLSSRDDVALNEFVLSEVYLHLRNPPRARIAARSCRSGCCDRKLLQASPLARPWLPPRNRNLHASLWKAAAEPGFARRRIYDLRTALCLQAFGVTEFATANVKDFKGTGFARVWNPLAD